ncbi:fluoride efflux transporter FluC [Sporosarcina siberiensis]|uniref:Fluoride-specific ion channel FluC n=1 Tax=Sporosarcina siberiensis TaxID=1365606 RepID=A0ABW4SGA1_9BACL
MNILDLVAIGSGGFLGAIIRYILSRRLNKIKVIPVGTLLINLTGALLIGVVFGSELSRTWVFFYASGLAGALTTFSTLNKEIIEMWESNKKKSAALYLVATYCGGLLLTGLGYWILS